MAEGEKNAVKKASGSSEEEEEPKRAKWGNHCEYFLSGLGMAVGLGNIWRFPYVCYENGGGTFLVPYCLMLLLIGIPMFFRDLALGQYAGLSATKVYARITPGLRGLGYGMAMIPTMINIYYTLVMAYAFFFLFSSFRATLPWTDCSNDFNTLNCYSIQDEENCAAANLNAATTFWNRTCTPVPEFCAYYGFPSGNYTHCFDDDGGDATALADVTVRTYASEDFWNRRVLGLDVLGDHLISTWDSWGSPRWEIIGCLLLCWTLVCLSLIKGVQSYGKVVYFTTMFPYVVLTVLLGYTSTLPGFAKGVEFYLTPKWERLADLNVWNAAAGQIFYSLGVGTGSHLILASYNDFRTNCHRDALLIGLFNSATSIFAGFVVFGTVGFIADRKGQEVAEVIKAGPGLAFVVYPEAVAAMDFSPPFFSFCFFFMLVLLAISSICGTWETLVGSLNDQFPKLRDRRVLTMAATCSLAFLAGVPMCFDSGFLLFQLMDDRTSKAILIMAFVELAVLSWFYGTDSLFEHITEMGMKLPWFMKQFWNVTWNFLTPLIMFVVIVLSWSSLVKDHYLDYVYPPAVQFLGWMLELAPILVVLLITVVTVVRKKSVGEGVGFLKPARMLRPKATWGRRPDAEGANNKAYDGAGEDDVDDSKL